MGYFEIEKEKKEEYFNKYYPFANAPKMDDFRFCIHCGQWIKVSDYKVEHNDLTGLYYISCPNAPECDGSIVDWMSMDYDGNMYQSQKNF